jgi:GT2 family glycosyltransferase
MIESCQLHGSFLVFSPKYIEREAIAFYPKTFLYYEEAILYQHCIDVGYKTLYYPDVLVYHKEDSSTSFLNNTEKKKREFVFRNLIASSMIYREFLGDKKLWDICSPKE